MSFGATSSIINMIKMQYSFRCGTIDRCPAASCGVIHFQLEEGDGVVRSKSLGRCHVDSPSRLGSRTPSR
jgi:hypothetical protein